MEQRPRRVDAVVTAASAYSGPERRRFINRSWPLPAFAAWAACWIVFAAVAQLGAGRQDHHPGPRAGPHLRTSDAGHQPQLPGAEDRPVQQQHVALLDVLPTTADVLAGTRLEVRDLVTGGTDG